MEALEPGGEGQQQRLRPGTGAAELHAEGQHRPLDLLAVQGQAERGRAEHVPAAGPRGEGALGVEVGGAVGQLEGLREGGRAGQRRGEHEVEPVEGLPHAPHEGLDPGDRAGEVHAAVGAALLAQPAGEREQLLLLLGRDRDARRAHRPQRHEAAPLLGRERCGDRHRAMAEALE